MDPNECLRLIREAITEGDEALSEGSDGLASAAYVRAAEHTRDLDEWLSKGGFLPAAWENRR